MKSSIALKKEGTGDNSKEKLMSLELYKSISDIIDVDEIYRVLTRTSVLRDLFNIKSEKSEYPYDTYFNDGVFNILSEVTEILENIKDNINGLHPGI